MGSPRKGLRMIQRCHPPRWRASGGRLGWCILAGERRSPTSAQRSGARRGGRRTIRDQEVVDSYRSGAASYLAIVLGWSTVVWAAVALLDGREHPSSSLLFIVGGASPPIVAVILTSLRETRATQRDFWIRIVDVRRIGWRWLCVCLLLPPALLGLAILLDVVLGGSFPPDVERPQGVATLLGLVFFVFWYGPLPEEIGWRGFALDRLQLRMSALASSLALGTIWASWHLPLFYIPGTYQYDLGFGTVRYWLFLAQFLPISVLMTWIYNGTRRSTLSAVLVHFSWNLGAALVPKTDRIAAFEFLFFIGAALVVIGLNGRAELYRSDVVSPSRRGR